MLGTEAETIIYFFYDLTRARQLSEAEADREGADSCKLPADRTPHHWAASLSLKEDLDCVSPYLPKTGSPPEVSFLKQTAL